MSATLRAGVIGLRRGLGFVRLLRALPGVDLVAVADVDEGQLGLVCQEYQLERGCRNLDELLQLDLDLVVIATPVAHHVEQTIEALDHGVNVLCEIPAVESLEECDRLVASVERSTARYMMAENQCYWPIIDTAKQLRDRGDFGTVLYSEAEYVHNIPQLRRDSQGRPTWRATLEPITYITHSIGPLIWVTGQYPTETTCYETRDHYEPGQTDLQVAIFKMTDGSLARVTISFANAHWPHNRYTFLGTHATLDSGQLIVGGSGLEEPKYLSPSLPNVSTPVRLPIGTSYQRPIVPPTVSGGGVPEMMSAFLRSIREGTRPPVDVYDAVMYSIPGLCALESARSGRSIAIPQYQSRRSG